MTIYDQNLGGFKRGNNECIRNREKVKLHKIKIVVFLSSIYGAMTHICHELRHYNIKMT